MFDPSTVIVLVLGSGLAIFAYTAHRYHSTSLPPGPTGLPLLGNALNFPKALHPQAFYKLTQKHGDIVHLNVLGQRMIILGSYSTASELLHTRSANTSERESSVMAELSGMSWNLLLVPYGKALRQGRKVLHRFFDSTAVSQFRPTQERHTRVLLGHLLETPDAFIDHIHMFVGATIMEVTYGLDVAGADDRFLGLLAAVAEAFESAFAPGKYLVETFPVLRNLPAWFPWTTFHRDAALYKECFSAMRNEPFDRTLENMRRGEGNPCMVSALMSDAGLTREEEQVARDAAGVVYMGGADTVNASLQVFFLAMVLHPEAQQKAQVELDTIVGRDRPPQITDLDSLPYLQAFILEVLRWRPIIGLGFPHKSRCDDVFRGYTIPKGSLIFASSWAISRDAQMYPDPDNFIPERFLRDGALNPDILDPRLYAFGHGRRICPGRHFAETSLFLTIASVLHAFTIKPRCDASGVTKLPEGKMKPGFLSFPEAFECEISPRSEKYIVHPSLQDFDIRRMFDLSTIVFFVLGPIALPLLGNVFNFPKSLDPQAFYELTRKHGDIVHLNVLGQPMIILGSYSTAVELLHTRSANNSDRQSSVMADLSGGSWILLLLPYGQGWRQGRKVLHRFFDPTAVSQFHSAQERHTRVLLDSLLETPDAFIDHLHSFVGATIMDITYGLDVAGADNRFIGLLANFAEAFQSAFSPGKYLVEMFPVLRHVPPWFPGATFHRDATLYRQSFSAMRNEPFDRTLDNMRCGECSPCMVSTLMSDRSDGLEVTREDEEVARDAAGVVYMGGADTVNASLQVFFLAMVLHPEAQTQAQAELDRVVMQDRLPQMSDLDSLPYIQALILEVLRWKPIIGLGFPHTSRSDDVLRGYRIPKGSLIFPSSWAISRDPQMYPDPDSFIPERFLRDGALNPDVLDPRLYAFGHGRRICPGRHFAETSLFLTIASVLHTFTIKPRCDASGVPKLPEGKMKPGFLSWPETFECEISPRSEKVEAIIKSEWAHLP
ncbi:hypothetical protein V8D89_006519 [Ganoderma adspersum]